MYGTATVIRPPDTKNHLNANHTQFRTKPQDNINPSINGHPGASADIVRTRVAASTNISSAGIDIGIRKPSEDGFHRISDAKNLKSTSSQPYDNPNKKISIHYRGVADGPNPPIAASNCSLVPSTSSRQRMAPKGDQQTHRGIRIKSSLKASDALSARLTSSLPSSANSAPGFGTTVRRRTHVPPPGSSGESSRTTATTSGTTDRNRSQRLTGPDNKAVRGLGSPTGRGAQTLRPIRSVPDTPSNGVPIPAPRPGSRPRPTRLGPRPASASNPADTHQCGGKVTTTVGTPRQLFWDDEVPARRKERIKEERKARKMKEKVGGKGGKGAESAGSAGAGREVLRVKREEQSMSITGSAGPGSTGGVAAAAASMKNLRSLRFSKKPKAEVALVVVKESGIEEGEVREERKERKDETPGLEALPVLSTPLAMLVDEGATALATHSGPASGPAVVPPVTTNASWDEVEEEYEIPGLTARRREEEEGKLKGKGEDIIGSAAVQNREVIQAKDERGAGGSLWLTPAVVDDGSCLAWSPLPPPHLVESLSSSTGLQEGEEPPDSGVRGEKEGGTLGKGEEKENEVVGDAAHSEDRADHGRQEPTFVVPSDGASIPQPGAEPPFTLGPSSLSNTGIDMPGKKRKKMGETAEGDAKEGNGEGLPQLKEKPKKKSKIKSQDGGAEEDKKKKGKEEEEENENGKPRARRGRKRKSLVNGSEEGTKKRKRARLGVDGEEGDVDGILGVGSRRRCRKSTVKWTMVCRTGIRTRVEEKHAPVAKKTARWKKAEPPALEEGKEASKIQEKTLRPSIWTGSKSELLLVLPELSSTKCFNGVTEGSSNFPMVMLEELTAQGVGLEVAWSGEEGSSEEFALVKLTLTRDFVCPINELAGAEKLPVGPPVSAPVEVVPTSSSILTEAAAQLPFAPNVNCAAHNVYAPTPPDLRRQYDDEEAGLEYIDEKPPYCDAQHYPPPQAGGYTTNFPSATLSFSANLNGQALSSYGHPVQIPGSAHQLGLYDTSVPLQPPGYPVEPPPQARGYMPTFPSATFSSHLNGQASSSHDGLIQIPGLHGTPWLQPANIHPPQSVHQDHIPSMPPTTHYQPLLPFESDHPYKPTALSAAVQEKAEIPPKSEIESMVNSLIPRSLPPEIDILSSAWTHSLPLIMITSRKMFDNHFWAPASPKSRGQERIGLAEEHAYVFLGFFRIVCTNEKRVAMGDVGCVGEGGRLSLDLGQGKMMGRVEWTFEVVWEPGFTEDVGYPWWDPVLVFDTHNGGENPGHGGRKGEVQRLNLLPTQLVDGQEEGSSDEAMPRGWLCKQCGRLNQKVMMRHRWCGSGLCRDRPISEGYTVALDCARDANQTALALPINTCNEKKLDIRVADWDDGMRTLKYRPARSEGVEGRGILKHVFTCNLADLQQEATPLFEQLQKDVCLAKRIGDSGPLFRCKISDAYIDKRDKYEFSCLSWGEAPQAVHDAVDLMDFMGMNYGEDEGLVIDQLAIVAWVSSGTRKTTETLPAKEGAIAMLCLGNDVVLTIIPKWEMAPEVQTGSAAAPDHLRPEGHALGDSNSMGSGGALPGKKDVPESMSVTLVHGDMLLFSGCDFEYSIKRMGTSLLLVGSKT